MKILIADEFAGHKELECETVQEAKQILQPYMDKEDMWFYNCKGEIMKKDEITDQAIKEAGDIKVALSQSGGAS